MLLVLWRQLVKKLFQPHNYTTRWQPGFAAGFFLSRRGEPFSLVPNRLDGDENAAQEFDRFDVTSLDRLARAVSRRFCKPSLSTRSQSAQVLLIGPSSCRVTASPARLLIRTK